jgi:hypothetical protein
MHACDIKRVIDEPMLILNSLIFSVLLESEKAKAVADLRTLHAKEYALKQF